MDFESALSGSDDQEMELTVKASNAVQMRDMLDRLSAEVIDEPEGDCGCDGTATEIDVLTMEGCGKAGCTCGPDCDCDENCDCGKEEVSEDFNDDEYSVPNIGDVIDHNIHGRVKIISVAEEDMYGGPADYIVKLVDRSTMKMTHDYLVGALDYNEIEEGMFNKASKMATGARIGAPAGPVGAAAGAAIGYGVAKFQDDAEDEELDEDDEDTRNNLSAKDLQNMVNAELNQDYSVIESKYLGKVNARDFYEILYSDISVGGTKFYAIRDVLVDNRDVSVGSIEWSNANLSKALAEFDKHTEEMLTGMEEQKMNEDIAPGMGRPPMNAHQLAAADGWLRKPARLDQITDNYSIKISEIDPSVEVLFDDDVFANRVDDHDDIGSKTFKYTVPMIFVLETRKGAYLIRSEGYDYVRYAKKIIDDTPEDDIHADLNRMRELANMPPMETPEMGEASMVEIPMMGEDAPFDMDDENNAPADPNDFDLDQDIVAFAKKGHSKRPNKEVNNSGDNALSDPTEEFVKESSDMFDKLSEEWNMYEDDSASKLKKGKEVKATSGYLNKEPRSEKQAKMDITKSRKKTEAAKKRNQKLNK